MSIRVGKHFVLMLATALLVILLPVQSSRPAPGGGVDTAPGTGATVRKLLLSLSDEGTCPDEVADRLTSLGPAILPTLQAMCTGVEEVRQLEVLAAARNRLKDDTVSSWLLAIATSGKGPDIRLAAWHGIELHGTYQCLDGLFDSIPTNTPNEKRVADRALTAVIGRSESQENYDLIRARLDGLFDDDRARVITCVAKADSPLGLRLLGSLIARYPNVDLAILSGLAGMKSRPPDGQLAASIRPILSSKNSNLRREALSALGKLHDGESVEVFLALLGEEHSGVAGNAHWALRRVSGLNLPRDKVRWKMWLTTERSWWEEEGCSLLTALEEGDEALILRALHQASLHRLYREKFEPILQEYAESNDPDLRAAALLALERLDQGGAPAPAIRGGGSMTALTPVPASEALAMLLPLPKQERKQEAPPEKNSNLLVFLLGVPICLSLLMKGAGFGLVDRLRSWFTDSATDQGPATIKLKPRAKRTTPPHG